MTLVRVEITLCEWKSHSACRNHTRACWNHTHSCGNHTRACENHTLHAEITVVRVEITLGRVEITLGRVEITLGRVFWKIERVLAKMFLKIDTHACEFHTQACHLHTCLFLRVDWTLIEPIKYIYVYFSINFNINSSSKTLNLINIWSIKTRIAASLRNLFLISKMKINSSWTNFFSDPKKRSVQLQKASVQNFSFGQPWYHGRASEIFFRKILR
jgi:hypothetical protein